MEGNKILKKIMNWHLSGPLLLQRAGQSKLANKHSLNHSEKLDKFKSAGVDEVSPRALQALARAI